MKKIFYKYILAFVSFAMLISVVHAYPIPIQAKELKSKTDAKIIIENYDLTSKERSILSHESINTKTYEYIEPTDEDVNDLIIIDADNFVINAKPYFDDIGNKWIPKKVIITENEESYEYTLIDGQTQFKANSDNYSVEVEYNLYISVDKDTQLRLLNTPYWLTYGIEALDVLYGVSIDLESVANYYMPQLIKLRDGVDTPYGVSISDENYVKAVTDLEKQLKNNRYSTKYFDINEEIAIYEPYSGISDQEYYFSKHAPDLQNEAIKMKTNLEYIANSQGFETIIKFASQIEEFKDMVNKLETMINYLETIIDDLDYALLEENWVGMNYDLLSTIEGETGIVDLLTKRGTIDDHSSDNIVTELFVSSKTLKCTINRDRVNVIVQAYVIEGVDSDELTLIESDPIEIALKHEMTAQEVSNAIKNKGIEDNVLKEWEEKYQINDTNYIRSVSDFGEKLIEDITYTITYMPRKYDVVYSDNGDTPLNVYYGYNLTLPKASSGFSYEYSINNEKYRENDVLKIVGNTTIDRIIGKEKVTDRLLNVLADDSAYNFDTLAKDILTNEAVMSDMVEYRIVEEMDVNTVIDYDYENKNYSLTVNSYPSGIDGMTWEPVAFTIVKGNKESGTKYKITDGKAIFKTDYLDGVNVYYELYIDKTENIRPISVTDDYLLPLINIPSQLLEDSQSQIESLDYLASLAKPGGYLTMGSAIYSALGMIKSNYDDKYGKDTSLYPEYILKEYNALIELRNECFNHSNGSQLYVYEYILKYMPKSMNENANGLGLIAYYSDEYGYEKYKYQLDLLIKNLNIVKESDEFKSLLTGQLAPYKEKVEKLIDVLDDIVLIAPNQHVDADHASAGKLFELLDDNKSCESYTSASGLTHRVHIQKPLEGKVSIIMSATVDGMKYNSTSIVYDVNKILTQEDVNNIKNTFNELYENFNSKYYTKKQTALLPGVGQRLTEDIYLNEIWSSTPYNVYIQDTRTNNKELLQSVIYKDTVITLEKPDVGYRYDYSILDEIKSAENSEINYTITKEKFDQLFETGELIIKRTVVDLTKEKLTNMINKLNKLLTDYNSGFVLTKDSDGYHAVLRVDPSESKEIQKLMLSIIIGMKDSNYGYIAISNKDQALWNAATAQISIQAYIDALMQSDMSISQIDNLIDSNGNIKETVIDSIGKRQQLIVGEESDLDSLGGLLYDSVLYLGTTSEDEEYIEVDFIVSIKDFKNDLESMKQIKEDLMNAKKYHISDISDGKLNVSNTLSDDTYSLILSEMILTGIIDFDKVNEINIQQLMSYFKQYDHLFKDETFTADTLLNTYKQLGLDIDINDRSKLINSLLEMNRNHIFEKNDEIIEDGISGQFKYSLEETIRYLKIEEEIQALLKEDEIFIPTVMTYTNLNVDYEAVIFNPYQSQSIQFIKVLDDDIELSKEENSIILLKDINHDIELHQISLLDLNGYKVNGSITSKDNCIILDSKNTGIVTGKLSKNIQIAGGSYQLYNIESYVKEGYKVENSRVISKYYTINETDDDIIVEINPELFYENKNYYDIFMKIIVSINDYTKAGVKIDDYELYSSSYQTISDFMKGNSNNNLINTALNQLNVQDVFNDLIQKVNSYTDNGTLAQYILNTDSYEFELRLNTDKNVIEGNIKRKEDKTSKKISIQLKKTESYENAITVLKDIADMSIEEIKVNGIQYDNTLTSDFENVKASLNVNNDVKYTIMLGTILAYGTDNDQLYEAMKNYIGNDELRENLKMDLLDAIHNLTTEEFINAFKLVSESNKTFSELCKELDFNNFTESTDNENDLILLLDKVMQDYVDYCVNKFELYGITGDSTLLKTDYQVNIDGYDDINMTLNLVAQLPCRHRTSDEYIAADSTCTKEGVIEIRCEECNEVLSTKAIPPKGHGVSYISGEKAPTCEEKGYSGDVICDDCNEVIIKGYEIPADGHKTIILNAADSTCTKEGYTGDFVCEVCEKTVTKGKVIEKLPHDFIDGICDVCKEKDPEYSPYLIGDVSGDNKVNALDYIKIKNHLMGTKYLSKDELRRADVSKDNKISALDYIKIKNHIMGTKKLF